MTTHDIQMRKRAAGFVWYIGSAHRKTSAGRRCACRSIHRLAAQITVVFLHRQIKNSVLNGQPWNVVYNTSTATAAAHVHIPHPKRVYSIFCTN